MSEEATYSHSPEGEIASKTRRHHIFVERPFEPKPKRIATASLRELDNHYYVVLDGKTVAICDKDTPPEYLEQLLTDISEEFIRKTKDDDSIPF